MARTQTMVQLNDELVSLLDAEAARQGISRSALIRDALEERLRDARASAIGEAIAEGYRRVPPGTPDEWGDLEEQTNRANRDLLRRLNAEEKAAGFEPW